MGREAKFRKDLSMPGMVAEMRRCFERIEDAVSSRGVSLSDCLMSGLAIFALKCPSLLRFDRDALGVWASRRCGTLHHFSRGNLAFFSLPKLGVVRPEVVLLFETVGQGAFQALKADAACSAPRFPPSSHRRFSCSVNRARGKTVENATRTIQRQRRGGGSAFRAAISPWKDQKSRVEILLGGCRLSWCWRAVVLSGVWPPPTRNF